MVVIYYHYYYNIQHYTLYPSTPQHLGDLEPLS
jgi:hypothetical protein